MAQIIDKIVSKPGWSDKINNEQLVTKWRTELVEQGVLAVHFDLIVRLLKQMRVAPKRTRYGYDEHEYDENMFAKYMDHFRWKRFEIQCGCSCVICSEGYGADTDYYDVPDFICICMPKVIPERDKYLAKMVVKSQLISSEVRDKLMEELVELESRKPDWHPGSKNKVRDLVHPSLFCYVDSITKLLPPDQRVNKDTAEPGLLQWLPAEVDIDGESVKFVSEINNLPKEDNHELYSTLEHIFGLFLPGLKTCLAKYCVSRQEKLDADMPTQVLPDDETTSKSSDDVDSDSSNDDVDLAKSKSLPDDDSSGEDVDRTKSKSLLDDDVVTSKTQCIDSDINSDSDEEIKRDGGSFQAKGEGLAKHRYLVDSSDDESDANDDKPLPKRLQVIVKLANTVLTPDGKEDFEGGSWHLEGIESEHIVATCIYYYNVHNIEDSNLYVRIPMRNPEEMVYPQGEYHALPIHYLVAGQQNAPAVQHLGSVSTNEGDCLIFPNFVQHKVSKFNLKDPSKPGTRNILLFWIIDPNTKILSTGDVSNEGMTLDDAKVYRELLMYHRKMHIDERSKIYTAELSLCEH